MSLLYYPSKKSILLNSVPEIKQDVIIIVISRYYKEVDGAAAFLLSKRRLNINVSSNRIIKGSASKKAISIESGGRRMVKIKQPK